MDYNLSEIAKKRGAFKPITPAQFSANTLYRIYRQPLSLWSQAAAGIIASWTIGTTAASLSDELDSHNEEILALLSTLQFAAFFASLEQWQRGKWIAEVQRASGMDVGSLLAVPSNSRPLSQTRAERRAGGVVNAARVVRVTPAGLTVAQSLSGIDAKLADAVAANASLVRSVSDDTRARIANAVFSGLQSGQSKIEVARSINRGLKVSSAKARKIAIHQVDAAVKQLTLFRFDEAGFEEADWLHFAGQKHPRREHIARNLHRYKLSDPVWGEMSWEGCKCYPRAAWPKK